MSKKIFTNAPELKLYRKYLMNWGQNPNLPLRKLRGRGPVKRCDRAKVEYKTICYTYRDDVVKLIDHFVERRNNHDYTVYPESIEAAKEVLRIIDEEL